MKPLATFKHISSKNANYGDAEKYLTFAHDEFTMYPWFKCRARDTFIALPGLTLSIEDFQHRIG